MRLNTLKSGLVRILSWVAMLTLVVLGLLVVTGVAQLWVYPYLLLGVRFGLMLGLPVIIVLALIRPTRRVAGGLLLGLVYLCGITQWVWSFIYVAAAWGWLVAVIGGFVTAGAGLIPMALIAALTHREWALCGEAIVSLGVIVVTSYVAMALLSADTAPATRPAAAAV